MRTIILLPMLLSLCAWGSCQRKPTVPQTVTVVVEKMKPIPSWATDALDKPQRVDGTVGAALKSEDQRGNVIDLANCHRRLLARMDRGEVVQQKECTP